MRYTDFVLLASEPRLLKAEGKKRLTFKLLAPGVFNDPLSSELDVRSLSDLKDKATSADANWGDAPLAHDGPGPRRLTDFWAVVGPPSAVPIYPEIVRLYINDPGSINVIQPVEEKASSLEPTWRCNGARAG